MEFRRLTHEDKPAIDRLMAEAFGGGNRPAISEDPETEKPKSDDTRPRVSLGLFDGPRLVAAAGIDAMHLTWGEVAAPMGGIGGVACTADQRGRGHVGRLMTESLQAMREAGQYLSGLYPFAFAFYRRHGWDWVGEQRRYTVPTAELKAGPEGKNLVAYDGMEALEIVRPVYDRFAQHYRGMGTRMVPGDAVSQFWNSALDHRGNRTTYVQVYHDPASGDAEGYLTFRYPNDGDTGEIGDFVANTPAAYKGLLSVLHYYGAQLPKVSFTAPADDPLPLHMMHWGLETSIRPLFMGRVVDAAAAFTALRPEVSVSGKIVVQVADAQCDWNNKTFALTLDSGHVSVAPTQETPGIATDIQTLSQAYWGQPSLGLLRASERLTVTDEAQYVLLSRLLPPSVCFLRDHF